MVTIHMKYLKKFMLLDFLSHRIKKKSLNYFLLIAVLLSMAIWASNVWIELQTQGRIFSNINDIPTKKVALLLGVNKYVKTGSINLYYKYRIEAAAQLYKAGKIKHIIVSGDNHTKYYNEPIQMRRSLIEKGIPATAITLDYAGFRTLDSVVRCREVFSQDDVIVVSQAFHNKRAVFISDFYGIKTIGFSAQDVNYQIDMKTQIREYVARFKAVLDLYVLGTQPKFLGTKVNVPV